MRVYVLCTTIQGEPDPCMPQVFVSAQEADANADQCLREEWATNSPCDDDGNALPYPGDWREANAFLAEYVGYEWGRWELTSHNVESAPSAPASVLPDLTTAELAALFQDDRRQWANYLLNQPDIETALNVYSDVLAYIERKCALMATTAHDPDWDGWHGSFKDAATYFVTR